MTLHDYDVRATIHYRVDARSEREAAEALMDLLVMEVEGIEIEEVTDLGEVEG